MAPLVKAFSERHGIFDTRVCVTAQHREMLDPVLGFFGIVPDFDLDIMKPGQTPEDVTVAVLQGMKPVLEDFRPDVVLVHGDTATSFAASLAAFYRRIAVAHVEAGLRTGDLYAPWPEEGNRRLTTHLSTWHFTPTENGRDNLLRENVPEACIGVTGNTVIDALFFTLETIRRNRGLERSIVEAIGRSVSHPAFDVHRSKFILVTGHRRENHGRGFVDICRALGRIAASNPDIHIVYPVHLNPRVQRPVKALLSGIENIHLTAPLQYEQFLYLMERSFFVMTDSGGIQEEAPSLGKPVLVMRETTERPEALEAGTVRLVGTDAALIEREAQRLLDDPDVYERMSRAVNPYGDGHACERIVRFIEEH